jgi:hypothetical protein
VVTKHRSGAILGGMGFFKSRPKPIETLDSRTSAVEAHVQQLQAAFDELRAELDSLRPRKPERYARGGRVRAATARRADDGRFLSGGPHLGQ